MSKIKEYLEDTKQKELKVMLEEEDGLDIFLEDYDEDGVSIISINKNK